MPTDFTLPELGEGIETGDVLRVLVKPGDTVAKEQAVVELETDKATIEVPSSVAGRVIEVKVKAGDKVKVGQVILSVEDAEQAKAAEPTSAARPAADDTSPAERGDATPVERAPAIAAPGMDDADGTTKQSAEPPTRPPAADKPGVKEEKEEDDAEPAEAPAPKGRRGEVVDITRGSRAAADAAAPSELPPAPAAPSVRRLARELGVDISDVAGSGLAGRISVDDVKGHVQRLVAGAGRTGPAAAEPLPDFSRWGEIDRQPMRAVRRKTAAHVSAAWTTIPHVTQHDVADITSLEESRKRYAKRAEAAGGNLTVTAIALKVVAAALKAFPQVNASIDVGTEEIIFKKYVHIGVAVDTDRGLLVPVIRDVETKNIIQLSVELSQLSEKARARKLSLEEMQGGSFTITNLGGIGGTAFSPIINAPEVAILGISRARMEPLYVRGSDAGQAGFEPRLMLPLSLSYDHRAIDGADGARFLRWIAEALEQPFLLALQG